MNKANNNNPIQVNLIGSFVFINQGYGVLSSIYHNRIDMEPFPETAKLQSRPQGSTDAFEGLYTTIWLETRHQPDRTDLEIIRQPNGTYRLRWFDATQTWYDGIGFVNDGRLVGAYWQEIINNNNNSNSV